MRSGLMLLRFALLGWLLLLPPAGVFAQSERTVWQLDVDGVIGPASADYIVRALQRAAEQNARAVVLKMDTPGGLDKSMRQIIRAILASPVPVIGYVAPRGARAASAGTYILYACHIAAMAPATNLGAATPVQIGSPGLPGMPEDQKPQPAEGEKPDKPAEGNGKIRPKTAMERKIINDASAYIEGLAELRGRNAEWAVKAVREAASLSAERAAEINVIDLMAANVEQLLQKIDGRQITLNEKEFTLNTADASIVRHEPDWRSEFLAVITDPNVAYILMLIGIYGIIFEFSNPGMGIPGIAGAICLLLALYAFQVLPVNYAGLGLILLGVGLMVAEAFSPSFGVLGLGGIVSFVVGSVILMDTELPGYTISLWMILVVTACTAALLLFLLGMVLRSRKQGLASGLPTLVGQQAVVEYVHNGHPMVRLQGELWQVNCDRPLQPGDSVRVRAAGGVVLDVEKIS